MSDGAFVWYDLMSTDPVAAREFYAKVVGWGVAEFPGGDPEYRMFMNGESPIGGSAQLPAEAAKMGAPTHWLGYVATDDADNTARNAVELGGNQLGEPFEVPSVGRFVVLQDPQGAVFAVFQPEGEMAPPEPGTRNVSWHELSTTDYKAARRFYAKLFGWRATEEMDMGGGMMYQLFRRDDSDFDNGGMFDKAPDQPGPPAWLYYIGVDDISGAVNRVKDAGGQVLNGPMEVPGGDMVAQCMDPQGGVFALHTRAG